MDVDPQTDPWQRGVRDSNGRGTIDHGLTVAPRPRPDAGEPARTRHEAEAAQSAGSRTRDGDGRRLQPILTDSQVLTDPQVSTVTWFTIHS
jgi:hypothetical protein